MSASSTPSKIPTITEFANVLSDEPGWYSFGIFMKISTTDLDNIDRNYGREGNMRCLIEMYNIMETRGLSLSWERIVESLKGVKNFRLAEKVRFKYILPCLQSSDSATPKSPSELEDLISQDISVMGRTTTEQEVIGEISKEFIDLSDEFALLTSEIMNAFKHSDVDLYKLQNLIKSKCGLDPLPQEEATIDVVFKRLDEYYSVLNFHILIFLVKNLLGENQMLQEQLSDYGKVVNKFTSSAKMNDLVNLIEAKQTATSKQIVIKLKVREFWSRFTMKQFEAIMNEILETLYMLGTQITVGKGCICISWTIPANLDTANLITPQPLQFLKIIGVVSLYVGEEVVYDIPGEGCDVLEAAMLQAIELNNTRAIELLSMMGCGPEIVSKYRYDTPPCMRSSRETADTKVLETTDHSQRPEGEYLDEQKSLHEHELTEELRREEVMSEEETSSDQELHDEADSELEEITDTSRPEDEHLEIQKSLLTEKLKQKDFPFVYRDPPERPGLCTKGRKIELFANHFKLQFPRQSCVYHYDVDILPGKCPRHINRQVIWQLQEMNKRQMNNCKLAFDGKKNFYTSKPLPSVNKGSKTKMKVTFTPEGEEKNREFEVHIQLATDVPLDVLQSMADLHFTKSEDHQSAIQALDIITRSMSSMRFTTVGRSFFSTSNFPIELGQGRVVWFGRYQSVRPSQWGIVLNVDVSATAFFKEQSALNFLCEVISPGGRGGGGYGGSYRGGSGQYGRGGYSGRGGGGDYGRRDGDRRPEHVVPDYLHDHERVTFAKEIKGLRVKTTHLSYPRKYKVKGVTVKPASSLSFDCEGKQCTVRDYFKNQYKKELRYPGLPCLHMEGKNNTIYIPIEFCQIIEQNCTRKLTPDQTTAMIRATAKPAYQRKKEILEKLRDAEFSRDPFLNDFGIKVYNEMARIEGRVLDPPKLQYKGKNSLVQPSNGQWDSRREKFYSGARINSWAVVVFPSLKYFNDSTLSNFIDGLHHAGDEKGMHFSDVRSDVRRVYYFNSARGDTLVGVFSKLKKEFRDLQLIVAVLDRGTSYSEVKRVGDNVVGVVTQCMRSRNASKCNPATMANICLKINTKLGGINSIVDPRERPLLFSKNCVIIFGADVTHPAPGDKRSPSIAAVTASMDEYFMEYRAVAKILRHRQEVMEIDQLAGVLRDMLKKFYVRNGRAKPTQILFYRDGVSNGQFKEVILNEVAAVQKACKMLQEGYEPGITFLVVQKRHHTRLFPVSREDQCGRGGNIPPGTVVDTVITHPREFDFFLCSHAGIQGTSKPCCYHVLWDDNSFTADDLQTLTYQLCHCYARCTCSVSYPAPTYYSHLVAFRARYHLQDWEEKRPGNSDSMSSVSFSSEELQQLIPEMQSAIELNDQLKDTMYFM